MESLHRYCTFPYHFILKDYKSKKFYCRITINRSENMGRLYIQKNNEWLIPLDAELDEKIKEWPEVERAFGQACADILADIGMEEYERMGEAVITYGFELEPPFHTGGTIPGEKLKDWSFANAANKVYSNLYRSAEDQKNGVTHWDLLVEEEKAKERIRQAKEAVWDLGKMQEFYVKVREYEEAEEALKKSGKGALDMERLEKRAQERLDELKKAGEDMKEAGKQALAAAEERQLEVVSPEEPPESQEIFINSIEIVTNGGREKTYFGEDALAVYNALERMDAHGSGSTGPIPINDRLTTITFYRGHIASVEVDYMVGGKS